MKIKLFGIRNLLFTALFIVYLTVSAMADFPVSNGNWSNGATWESGTVPDNVYETYSDNICLCGSHQVTVDGIYNYDNLSLKIGTVVTDWNTSPPTQLCKGEGIIILPSSSEITFSSARWADAGSANRHATIIVEGGNLFILGDVQTHSTSVTPNSVDLGINISSGSLDIGGIFNIFDAQYITGLGTCNITVNGSGILKAADIIKHEDGGSLNFTVGGGGKVIVSGDRTADPTLNGILMSSSGQPLSATYSNGETIIMDSAKIVSALPAIYTLLLSD